VLDDNRAMLKREAYRNGDGLPTQAQADKARKAHAAAYAGVVDPLADVAATPVPTYLPRNGQVLDMPTRQVEVRRISVVEACKQIKARLGAAYTPQVFADVAARWPDGVPETEVDVFVAERCPVALPNTPADGLRLIGGGAA
jgi:hypothetical protein